MLNLSVTATALAQDRALTGLAGQLLGGPAHLMENKITYKQRVAGHWPNLRVPGEQVHKIPMPPTSTPAATPTRS